MLAAIDVYYGVEFTAWPNPLSYLCRASNIPKGSARRHAPSLLKVRSEGSG
jgi:hypothetical protein